MIKDGDRIALTMVFKGVFSVCDVSFDGLSGAFALDPLLVYVNDKKDVFTVSDLLDSSLQWYNTNDIDVS